MYLWIIDNGEIKVYCRTYTKVLIVARIEERKKNKKKQTRGGKTTLRYTYKYIYVTLRYIKVPLCNNM